MRTRPSHPPPPFFHQAVNLIILAWDTRYQFISSIWVIFVWIIYEGLLGGAVYGEAA